MFKNSTVLNTVLTFLFFTGLVLVLIYVVGMPTTNRMNFFMLGSLVGSALGLLLGAMFPTRLAKLCRLVHLAWIVIILLAIIALGATVICFVAKKNLPVLSEQWYGVLMAMGALGVSKFKAIAHSYWECVDCDQDLNKAHTESGA